jgi:hypothetical protein
MIVMGLIACMLSSGTTVWAQSGKLQLPECSADAIIEHADWAERCIQARRAEMERLNPPPPEVRMRSKTLATVGLFTLFAGMGAALHFGEDTKNVLGNQYCVSDYGDVEYGSCGSPMQTQIGLIMIGSGALMAWVGFQDVAVTPQVSKDKKAVVATVAWGGSR